jgi:katanin p60 ATPase-containing subunit A1
MSERYSILDLSKMVKIARENAILGLYEKALEKYKIAVPIIENRIKEVNEEIIKNKWKNLENCIKKELATIRELVETREVFKKVYVESEAKKANNVANVDFSYKDNNNNMDDKNARDAEDILKDINFVKNIANQAENKINNIQKKKDEENNYKPNNDFNRYANNNYNNNNNKKEEKKYTPPQKNNNYNNYNNNNNYNNKNNYVPPRGGGGGGRINPMVQINNALNNYQPSKKMYDKYGKLANYGPDGYMGGGGGAPSSGGYGGYSNNRGGSSKSGNNNNNNNKNDNNKSAFLLHCYPDGVGPDSELIEMLEREVVDSNPHVQFNDIAELKNAKGALMEAAILPLMKPEFFKGIRRPWKGILLYGPPGTGKTMLAKALATQNRTTFFNVHSSSFASKWRGESEKLVRILFEMAQFYAPTTIFIDEVDSLCSKRGEGGEGNDSRRVKTEILVRMDGLNSDNNTEENGEDSNKNNNNNKKGEEPPKNKIVTVVGATNRPWDLDDALRRRFEKRIYIPLPNVDGRRQLFELNLKKVAVDSNLDYDKLIKATDGYSGADISNVCREAALMPLRKALKANKGREIEDLVDDRNFRNEIEKAIGMEDLNAAIENISKSVSKKDLETYDQWTKEFGSV